MEIFIVLVNDWAFSPPRNVKKYRTILIKVFHSYKSARMFVKFIFDKNIKNGCMGVVLKDFMLKENYHII